MKVKKFNEHTVKKCVLIAPLDWGLGHATRCIPIIYELLDQNCNVLIATDGASKKLLQQEFPSLIFLPLKGYKVKYSTKKFWLPIKIFFQLPRLIHCIYYEHQWLKKIIPQFSIKAVISDNRYGLYTKAVPCIFITHQLQIKTGNSFIERLIQKINYHFINKYTKCWVPDNAGVINFAGELSHPPILPKKNIKYLGPLSRFKKLTKEIKYDLIIIISGPEPQRTIFEKLLITQIEEYTGNVLFIRGLPANETIPVIKNKKVEIKNHLSADMLNEAIQQSGLVISRSGYTTIMDLIKLQQKAVLIPTPGQTEQEYLARYLMEKKIFYTAKQSDFLLQDILDKINTFPFALNEMSQDEEYKIEIKNLIDLIP